MKSDLVIIKWFFIYAAILCVVGIGAAVLTSPAVEIVNVPCKESK